MAIKVTFEVTVSFVDNRGPCVERNAALEEALSEAFECDDGVFDFFPAAYMLDGVVSSFPGSLRLEYDDINEAVTDEREVEKIIEQHGFSLI